MVFLPYHQVGPRVRHANMANEPRHTFGRYWLVVFLVSMDDIVGRRNDNQHCQTTITVHVV